jgi:hypothetical protein
MSISSLFINGTQSQVLFVLATRRDGIWTRPRKVGRVSAEASNCEWLCDYPREASLPKFFLDIHIFIILFYLLSLESDFARRHIRTSTQCPIDAIGCNGRVLDALQRFTTQDRLCDELWTGILVEENQYALARTSATATRYFTNFRLIEWSVRGAL